jgi:hypothetical protein
MDSTSPCSRRAGTTALSTRFIVPIDYSKIPALLLQGGEREGLPLRADSGPRLRCRLPVSGRRVGTGRRQLDPARRPGLALHNHAGQVGSNNLMLLSLLIAKSSISPQALFRR